ncbi:MAG: hypothetical protein PUC27_02915 [Clostridium sp.]|nr:hypothetical protein [Clostridium sp.]MDY5002384.1 hypothetical protein [Eubacteriales bacterium]
MVIGSYAVRTRFGQSAERSPSFAIAAAAGGSFLRQSCPILINTVRIKL